jgi:hypothetical protein
VKKLHCTFFYKTSIQDKTGAQMNLKKLFGSVAVVVCCLVLALFSGTLLAPSASASTITLDGEITSITLTYDSEPSSNLTSPLATSSVSGQGSAQYNDIGLTTTETYPLQTVTGTSPSINHSGTFLQSVTGSISGGDLKTGFTGVGPYSSFTQTSTYRNHNGHGELLLPNP